MVRYLLRHEMLITQNTNRESRESPKLDYDLQIVKLVDCNTLSDIRR